MTNDEGPYLSGDGDLWVPRTVPWRRARAVALSVPTVEYDQRLVYLGKTDATLSGFARDCRCEDECELDHEEDGPEEGMAPCKVPAWHFRIEEKP